jgi:hypothetical protein
MKHIRFWQGGKTWKSAYEALSNYCFPPDFRLQLRDQLLARVKEGIESLRKSRMRLFIFSL